MSSSKLNVNKKFLVIISVILLASMSSMGAASAFTGAIYTTDISCTGVNVNQFADKTDVYLDGGPQGGGSGIPDGYYYVQVTNPSGSDLLGTSVGSPNPTPVHVTGGSFDSCYQLSDIVYLADLTTKGYLDTTNGGGVYKVWVSPDSAFADQKTDNFKVGATSTGGEGTITLIKQVNNNHGGNAGPNDFGLTIGGAPATSGVAITVPANTLQAINEAGLVGYNFVSLTGDIECPNVLGGDATVTDGQDITCYITNEDIAPCLTLTKVVINGPFGLDDKAPADFNPTVNGVVVTSGVQTCELQSNTPIPIDETQLSGFEFQVTTTDDAKCPNVLGGTVTLDEGENISCTITNKDTRGKIAVYKFYDTNANGVYDNPTDPLIAGWKIAVDNIVHYTFFGGLFNPGQHTVNEFAPLQSNWLATTPTSVNVNVVTGQQVNVKFGNVCFAPGGGKTLGFWSNNNGFNKMNDGGTVAPELAFLSSLNLRDATGSNFDPVSYNSLPTNTAFRPWILGANAVNMSYMLSAQLAAMELNVEAGYVSGSSLVYAPGLIPYAIPGLTPTGFISINDLMTAANSALGVDGYTPAGDPNRAVQGALKNVLDAANNNKNFLSPTACTFSFAP